MKEYHTLEKAKKEEIIQKVKQALSDKKEVLFAYVFGSFLDSPSFRDIDIGVYIKKIAPPQVFDYELQLSQAVAEKCGLPFDFFEVKVLNFAPSSFLNNIFCRGQLLFSKNQKLLSNIIEDASLEMIANESIASQSLQELIPS